MESSPASIEQQRNATMEQARAGLDAVFSHLDTLPDEEKRPRYVNIAWAAAAEGLWGTLDEHYEGDVSDFIVEDPEKRVRWVAQFAEGGDFVTGRSLADTIESQEAKKSAYVSLARQAARRGDVALTLVTLELGHRIEEDTDEARGPILSELFCALADQARWTEADELMQDDPKVGTYPLLHAADNAAKQGEFERFVALTNKALRQSPTVAEGRGDSDGGDFLERPIGQAAQTAFITGNYSFIASMGTNIEWPDDAQEHWQDWVTSGVINGVYTSENFEAGINMYTAMALDAGESHSLYAIMQEALGERNWDILEILASEVNSEILGMLHRLAHKEGQLETAQSLAETLRSRGYYHGNYLLLSDDTAPTMMDEAKKGNWEAALGLRDATLHIFAYDNAKELVKIAISQEKYDILSELIGEDNRLLNDARALLENRGLFEVGENLTEEWLRWNPNVVEVRDFPWFRLNHLNHTAPTAAAFGDWRRALSALEQMDRLAQAEAFGHRGYEFVAIEALRILSAARAR